jgi:hypothetical protein
LSDRSDDVAWHWLAPDGKPAQGSETELRDKLANRSLPPSTRVWRSGWAEWLPANRAKELASSLPPGTKLTAREPRLDPAQTTPPDPKHTEPLRPSTSPPRVAAVGPLRPSKPPLPSGLSQAVGRTPATAPPTVPRVAPTPPPPSQHAAHPHPPKPPTPPVPRSTSPGMAPPDPVRPPTATPRPPSAVPPPPPRVPSGPVSHQPVAPPPRSSPAHAAPAPSVVVSGDAPARTLPEPPLPPPSNRTPAAPPAATAAAASPPGGDDAEEVEADTIGAVLTDPPTHAPIGSSLPPIPPNAPLPNDMPLPSFPASSGAPSAGPSLPPSISPAVGNLRAALVVVSLIAAALVLLLVLTWIFGSGSSEEVQATASASAAPSAAPSASPAPAPATKGCILAVPAAKLAASVERGVAPNLFTLDDGRVAVGFATKPTQANGIVVDLRTLDVQAVFYEPGTSAVRNVAPSAGSPASFAVDREDHPLSQARSLEPGSRALLGFTKDGLARANGKSVSDEIWKVATDKVTEARASRAGDAGYLVTFRRGGLGGDILAGWLGQNLAKKSELEVLPAGVRFVGTPVVAAHPNATLIAFAGRNDENADWRIRLARGEAGQVPRTVSDFALPPGGPGGGAIAPWLAPLDQNRWVLQWTEGGTGQYQVRVQALSADLAPVGTPALASPKGASAGQGAVWLAGTRALSLFVLTVGGFDELWGASLECH